MSNIFDDCNTLAELNAERIKATTSDVDLVTINNMYNERRQELLTSKKPFVVLKPVIVKPREVTRYSGIPIVGRTKYPGCIQLTDSGFLY
jgi:hypothetical protein